MNSTYTVATFCRFAKLSLSTFDVFLSWNKHGFSVSRGLRHVNFAYETKGFNLFFLFFSFHFERKDVPA